MIRLIFSVFLPITMALTMSTVAHAQTTEPDPCEEFKAAGVTKGLYGICVAYQKALEREETEPSDGRVAQRLLETFLKLANETDPPLIACPVFNKPFLEAQNAKLAKLWEDVSGLIIETSDENILLPEPGQDLYIGYRDEMLVTDGQGIPKTAGSIERGVHGVKVGTTNLITLYAKHSIMINGQGEATQPVAVLIDAETGKVVETKGVEIDVDQITPEQLQACEDLIVNTDLPALPN